MDAKRIDLAQWIFGGSVFAGTGVAALAGVLSWHWAAFIVATAAVLLYIVDKVVERRAKGRE